MMIELSQIIAATKNIRREKKIYVYIKSGKKYIYFFNIKVKICFERIQWFTK